jgi:YkoY family integral membrane protein
MLDQLASTSIDLNPQTFLVLLVLVALEAVLSADNAVALAAIAQGIPSLKEQRRALNVGLILAYVLRIVLILTATWVVRFWQFELLGAAYLLWLVFNYFTSKEDEKTHHHTLGNKSFWQTIPLIALTDLAFSLDSVTTSIAVADETWLILVGGTVGVITLRFLAELFIKWLQEYTYLEDAGFVTVALVGVRLLLKVFDSPLVPPEWLMVSAIVVIFTWGFSKKNNNVNNEVVPQNETD